MTLVVILVRLRIRFYDDDGGDVRSGDDGEVGIGDDDGEVNDYGKIGDDDGEVDGGEVDDDLIVSHEAVIDGGGDGDGNMIFLSYMQKFRTSICQRL